MGESPGREEAEVGRPFVGTTGRQLDAELLEAGLRRSRLFVVNAVCCPPPKVKDERAMMKAVRACNPALVAQLGQLEPTTPTFSMGRWAYIALTGKIKGVMQSRGFVRSEFRLPRASTSFDGVENLFVERDWNVDDEDV